MSLRKKHTNSVLGCQVYCMGREGDVGVQPVWKVGLAGVLQRVDILNCGPAMPLHHWIRESAAMLEAAKAAQCVPNVLPSFGAVDCPVSTCGQSARRAQSTLFCPDGWSLLKDHFAVGGECEFEENCWVILSLA